MVGRSLTWGPRTDADTSVAAEVDVVDQVLSQEDRELEALVSLMEERDGNQPQQQQAGSANDFGSDDDSYEDIFLEVMDGLQDEMPEGGAGRPGEQDQEMDFSKG